MALTPEQRARSSFPQKGGVVAEDVIKLFSLALESADAVKAHLSKRIEAIESDSMDGAKISIHKIEMLSKSILDLSERLEDKLSFMKESMSEDVRDSIRASMDKIRLEMRDIQALIPPMPDMPDMSPLVQRMDLLEGKIMNLAPEVDLTGIKERILALEAREIPEMPVVTPEEIRDKLEMLEDDERLDPTSIRNLPNIVASPNPPENPKKFDLWVKTI